ncbi:hypothetical protein F4780DRAFT_659524 [Xylariomycetidae sp. FL0641]|nr:hypothetical protein F4780DRAFT_659524 [Xylariomycetidae sp. FL0641]
MEERKYLTARDKDAKGDPLRFWSTVRQNLPEREQGALAKLPIELIWHICQDLSREDLFRLARVSRGLWLQLVFPCALEDAYYQRVPRRSTRIPWIHVMLHQGRSLYIIGRVVAAYEAVAPWLLEAVPDTSRLHPPQFPPVLEVVSRRARLEPALFLAVRRDRLDVVRLLLDAGCRINIRWCAGRSFCPTDAHVACVQAPYTLCQNALSVARSAGNKRMIIFLLANGIDDMDNAG